MSRKPILINNQNKAK